MQTFGVICDATGFVVFVGQASDALDACRRATAEVRVWGDLGPFQRNSFGAPKDDGKSWLELSVYDVTGTLEPNADLESPEVISALTEERLVDGFLARQF